MALDNSLVAELRYEWFRKYKTEISETRIRKEFKTLAGEPRASVKEAFMACISQTPARFFSWSKFRDTWKSYLKENCVDPESVFNAIMNSSTGYAPAIGMYWTIVDIRHRFGDQAADAIEKIGGPDRLRGVTTDQKKWLEKEFVNAY